MFVDEYLIKQNFNDLVSSLYLICQTAKTIFVWSILISHLLTGLAKNTGITRISTLSNC